ncbi:hypothetical protein [Kutzneria kofuensis]|uniref:hypothetical protein n=1 Tax=Kutzneria kofuensis TaxID=103725 RepID=UPI0031EB372C
MAAVHKLIWDPVPVTEYAYDRTRNVLLAVWSVGIGTVADTVVAFDDLPAPEYALQLGYELTQLSKHLWRTYTHPLTEAVDQPDEALSRARNQLAIDLVTGAMRDPHLPVGDQMQICESEVLEAGHQVGRILHRIGDRGVTDQAVTDVEAEIDALRRAALGDLTGRANQAVVLTRSDPQPQQVAAAHAYFEKDPMGPPELYTKIDATSAAVAAVHWLDAALMIASRAASGNLSDAPPTCRHNHVDELADEVPVLVVQRLDRGELPRDVVMALVRDGMPARTLLEQLLIGIHNAWQLYGEWNKTVPADQINDTFRARTRRMAVEGRDRIL